MHGQIQRNTSPIINAKGRTDDVENPLPEKKRAPMPESRLRLNANVVFFERNEPILRRRNRNL
jgi:hypothetical protein